MKEKRKSNALMSTNRHKIFIEASSIESEFRHLNEMGSLPNLNELCGEKTIRRTAEKELDMARERARQLEFNRDGSKNSSIKERLKVSKVFHIYFLSVAGLFSPFVYIYFLSYV